jgi:hypothetical protein
LEEELQKLQPAAARQEFNSRLADSLPSSRTPGPSELGWLGGSRALLRLLLRVAVPAFAAVLLVALVIRQAHPPAKTGNTPSAGTTGAALKADDVEISQQFVATFDAVACLPDGEPMRFRCSQWIDDVEVRDSARGIVIQRQTPRVEIVPVGFDIY